MLTLVLTRHGSTPRSDPEQHLGQRLDLPLSDTGRAAARALGERLAGVPFDRVVSSPLARGRETASLVVPGVGFETDARLAEMDYGRWEGLTYAQITAADAAGRWRWEEDPAGLACPGGESGDQVASRVRSLLADLLDWADGSGGSGGGTGSGASVGAPVVGAPAAPVGPRVLLVAHSTTNRVLLAVALGVPVRDYRRRFTQAPANLTVLQFPGSPDEGARLLVANDVSHIRGIRGDTWE
jgi:broad specificity phosphatase PhoE